MPIRGAEMVIESIQTQAYNSQHYMLTSVDVSGFSKVFSTMWAGTLYGRFEASAVFMVLLSLCNKDGCIDMTPEAIAGATGWPLDLISRGIDELAAPDPRSRTPDEEGRRIVLIDKHRDWGWRITNYLKYRDKMRSAERREYLRQAKQKERSRKSTNVNRSTEVNRSQPIADTDTEADKTRGAKAPVWQEVENLNHEAWQAWLAYRRSARLRNYTTLMKAKELAKLPADRQLQCVNHSIGNQYNGIFPEKFSEAQKSSDSFDAKLARTKERAGL